jgi:hypothetical protein
VADISPVTTAVDAYAKQVADERARPLEEALSVQQGLTRDALDEVARLKADNERLQAELDACRNQGGAQAMWVGAANNMPSGLPKDNTLANFQKLDAEIGPLLLRRSFPTSANIVAVCQADLDAGYIPVVSLKRGPSDAQWATVGRTLPAGSWLIINHEHQKDFARAKDFVTFYRHVTEILLHESGGHIAVGDASLGYAYRHPNGMVGKAGINQGELEPAAAWLVGDDLASFHALDVYSQQGVPLAEYPNFLNWYESVKDSKLPLVLAEYGTLVVPTGATTTAAQDARRAELYAADFAYLQSLGFTAVLLWNGGGDNGWWAPDGPKARDAFKAVAKAGRTA